MVISAADHIVMDVPEFVRVIRHGLAFTEKENRILTLGMLPTRPETGYGYIKVKTEQVAERTKLKWWKVLRKNRICRQPGSIFRREDIIGMRVFSFGM